MDRIFLEDVLETAQEASDTMGEINNIKEDDFAKIQKLSSRSSERVTKVLRNLFELSIVDSNAISKWKGFTRSGVLKK